MRVESCTVLVQVGYNAEIFVEETLNKENGSSDSVIDIGEDEQVQTLVRLTDHSDRS